MDRSTDDLGRGTVSNVLKQAKPKANSCNTEILTFGVSRKCVQLSETVLMDWEEEAMSSEMAFIGTWLQAKPGAKPLDDQEVLAELKVWQAQDGRRIPYPDLEDGHLLNLLLFLRRTALQRAAEETKKAGVLVTETEAWKACKPEAWDGLVAEGVSRGGMVGMAAERIDEGIPENLLRSMVKIK